MANEFRTVLLPQRAGFEIAYGHQLVALGSCFAETMGARLSVAKFEVLVNPFGIVYNPISIAESLMRLLGGDGFTEGELWQRDGLWHSFMHHGSFSAPEQSACLENINNNFIIARNRLKNTDFLIITLGTSFLYKWKETGKAVANCHKWPTSSFDKCLPDHGEIIAAFEGALAALHQANDKVQVILTVSPVRHLRDGLLENQRSKARLLLACEALCERFGFAHYFPAYELLLDDLRDYRFYEADMLHPNSVAQDYIWQYFCDTYFSEKTKSLLTKIEAVRRASQHRPFHEVLPQHQAFRHTQLAKIQELETQYPTLDFSAERKALGF